MDHEERWIRREHWQDARGHGKYLGTVWTVTKAGRTASCVVQGHPLGMEAHILVDHEVQRTEAFRDSKAMIDATWEWRCAFEAKGWLNQ